MDSNNIRPDTGKMGYCSNIFRCKIACSFRYASLIRRLELSRFSRLTLTSFLLFLNITPSWSQIQHEQVSGILSVQWGDPDPNSNQPGRIMFELTNEHGKHTALNIDKDQIRQAGGLMILNRQWVSVDLMPQQLHSKTEGRRINRISRAAAPSHAMMQASAQMALSGSQPWITLPCKFADIANEPENQAFFIEQYGNDPGELNHFWKTESYNIINIDGSTSTNWKTLPNNRSTYVPVENGCFSTPANLNLLFDHCVAAHNPTVDFSSYIGINMAFNGDLDGCAWGGGRTLTLDGVFRFWSSTWLPPWAFRNNSVFEHENGHGYGLPHSTNWDNDGYPYDNEWDYMSGGDFYPGSNAYGNWGTGGMAYHKEMLNWLTPAEIVEITEGMQIVDLDPLGAATASNPRMIKLPLGGNRYWTIEARNKSGTYESGIPDTAVLISEVDENGRNDPIWVYDAQMPPSGNNNNEGTMWKVGEIFSDATNSITVEIVDTLLSGGFRVKVTRPDDCTPSMINLSDAVVTTSLEYTACEINAGPNYQVMGPGGNLTLNANTVRFSSGFSVVSGGQLFVHPE